MNLRRVLVGCCHRYLVGWLTMAVFAAMHVSAHAQCESDSFIGSNTDSADRFGWAVDVYADWAIVGAPGYSTSPIFSQGAVYFLRDNGLMWVQDDFANGQSTTGTINTEFGSAVAIDGDVAVVGASGESSFSGAAYVYRFNGVDWDFEQRIAASDGGNFNYFGRAVAVRGDSIVVGSSVEKAYAYHFDGAMWNEVAIFTAFDGETNAGFGESVAIGGDDVVGGSADDLVALVGAPEANSSGSVYSFRTTSSPPSWSNGDVWTPSDGANGDDFGAAVDITPSYDSNILSIVVGSPRHDSNGPDRGAVYQGYTQFSGTLFEQGKVVSLDGGKIGTRVSISRFGGGMVSSSDVLGTPAGAVYVFRRSTFPNPLAPWEAFGVVINSDSTGDDRLGFSVAVGDGVILAGAPYHDFNSQNNSGAVYEFLLKDCNGNDVIDCNDIADMTSLDCNMNGIPDECDADCNQNGIPDDCDLASGYSADCDNDGQPDECVSFLNDCNDNGVPDFCDLQSDFIVFRKNVIPPLAIPDGTAAFVSSTLNVPHSATITDLNIGLRIDHTYNGDLIVRLTHDGVTVVLMDRPGFPALTFGSNDDGYDITLDDEGTGGPIEDVNLPSAIQPVVSPPSYVPEEALSAFDGMNLSGDWLLEVSDNEFQDVGALISFELIIDLAPDCDSNGVLDFCELNTSGDCDGDGVLDICELAAGAPDCNGNGLPDNCEVVGRGEVQELLPSDTYAQDGFGRSVAIDGDVAAIGQNDSGISSGVYIFRRETSTGQWLEEQKLLSDDLTFDDQFGNAVALDGDVLMVGAVENEEIAFQTGAVYVFRYMSGSGWTFQQKLIASDAALGDRFGRSIDLRGDVAIIGANSVDVGGNVNSGAAYVFRYNNILELWQQEQILVPSDPAEGAWFGYSVALGEDFAVIGSPFDNNANGNDAGAVYVFTYNDTFGTWSEFDKLLAPDGAAGDDLGISVAVNQNATTFPFFVASGAPDHSTSSDNNGAVYVWMWEAGGITLDETLSASDAQDNTRFGEWVAWSSRIVLIGANRDTEFGEGAGAAYVYTREDELPGSLWTEQTKLLPANSMPHRRFGADLALDPPYAIVTEISTFSGPDSSPAHVFTIDDCNDNGVLDCLDIFCMTSNDVDGNGVPDECAPPCPEDIVTSATFQPPPDGIVDGADLAFLLGEWGANPGSPADLVNSNTFAPPPDGVVDGADLAILLGAWGDC